MLNNNSINLKYIHLQLESELTIILRQTDYRLKHFYTGIFLCTTTYVHEN